MRAALPAAYSCQSLVDSLSAGPSLPAEWQTQHELLYHSLQVTQNKLWAAVGRHFNPPRCDCCNFERELCSRQCADTAVLSIMPLSWHCCGEQFQADGMCRKAAQCAPLCALVLQEHDQPVLPCEEAVRAHAAGL